jgi:hypothetical protein
MNNSNYITISNFLKNTDTKKSNEITIISKLRGIIPNELYEETHLIKIFLFDNLLQGNISENIGNLTNLIELFLDSNKLTGIIPKNICNLTNLTELSLASNKLTGEIPEYIDNLKKLTALNLSNNKLTGIIPENICNLTNLINLNLYNNELSCRIPENIGNLFKLKYLDFSFNKLTGEIPSSINNLSNTYITFNNNMIIFKNLKKVPYNSLNNYNLQNKDIQQFNISNLINNNTDIVDKIIYKYIFSGYVNSFIEKDIYKLEKKYPDIHKRFNQITELLHNRQQKIYPKIYNAVNNYENLYFISAHGEIFEEEYLFVPSNLSIITMTTPSYMVWNPEKESILSSIDKYYLQTCLPGISYKYKGTKINNQLRFFKSGDIINNIFFDFKMKYNNNNQIYQGGIIKINEEDLKYSRTYIRNNKNTNHAKLNWHIGNNKENISWPEITPINYETSLQDIILKFKNKPGHYVLIVGSCLFEEYEIVKNESIIYKKYDLLKNKLACFQNLARKIENNTKNKTFRLQNFSSTLKKKQNCYNEIISKLKKKINTFTGKNKQKLQLRYNQLTDIYKENYIFTLNYFILLIGLLDDLTPDEITHYYNNNNNNNISAENKRKSRINNSQNNNNTQLPNWF